MAGLVDWATYLGSFLLVIALLGATLLVLRRASSRIGLNSSHAQLQVLESRAIGPRHRLLLVSAAGRTVLVGLSPQGMSMMDLQAAATAREAKSIAEARS